MNNKTTVHIHKKFTRQGVTLVELIIAMFVLVVGIGTLFESMVTSKRVNDRATNQARAYEEIQAQIETLQYMPFDSVRRDFKGIAFDVQGLRPMAGTISCGTVTNLRNPNPDNAATNPNPNKFLMSDQILPLRFRVAWEDIEGPAWVETVYIISNRGF